MLVALLPFHALFVTVATRYILGPDNPPMGELALWKEAVLAVILGVAILEIVLSFSKAASEDAATTRYPLLATRFDVLDWIVTALIVISVGVTHFTHGDWSLYAFGFRYDFVPLVAFLVLRRVSWSDRMVDALTWTVLGSGTVVALYALLTIVLPDEFFRMLGYSDLHSLYVPGRPIAAFQLIGETGLHRLQGPMSGPNQLGLWLLLPLGFALAKRSPKTLELAALFLVTIVLTLSRAAWIGAAILVFAAFWPTIRRASVIATTAVCCGLIVLIIAATTLFPSVILRLRSSEGHLKNPIAAVQRMIERPLGAGLGTAGPASNRVSDACVFLKEGEDPTWARPHKDLCVFVGETRVQPIAGPCDCPFLPENWYLQIGVEMGWLGFALYLMLVATVLYRTRWATFAAVSVTALFLHAFEDAALAYTLWILIALSLPPRYSTRNSSISVAS